MSDLNFFMSGRDTEEFLAWLINLHKPRFVADWGYTSKLPVYETLDELLQVIRKSKFSPRFHVLSDSWSVRPLSVTYIEPTKGRRPYYSVDQRYGGPAFDYHVPRYAKEGRSEFIVGGWFTDYASYYVRKGKPESFPRPAAMFAAFKEIQKYTRANARPTTCVEGGWCGPWVFRDALELHSKGLWLRLGDKHFTPKKTALRRIFLPITSDRSLSRDV